MEDNNPYGKVYTTCKKSYRGKAERRQREFRANQLKAGWREYGHWLDSESADAGNNIILPICHEAARKRDANGKGVGQRTFENMLSSQAMGFNIFEPLNEDKKLCQKVLSHFFPDIRAVNSVTIEYTPDNGVFQDQSAKGGVDCDVLVEAVDLDGNLMVIVIETKFVEPEFSICGYRKTRPKNSKTAKCPDDVCVKSSINNCLYVNNKKPPYLYWQRTLEQRFLKDDALPATGCPFGGSTWQLWVNYALAHEEARARKASKAYYAVCASSNNKRLLKPKHNQIEQFQCLIKDPDSVKLIDIDLLISVIKDCTKNDNKVHVQWVDGLMARYANIG